MKLSIKAVSCAVAVFGGLGFLFVALCNLIWPSYGQGFLEICSSIYPGYHATRTLAGVVVGTLYALLDGAVDGAILAWLYNHCAG